MGSERQLPVNDNQAVAVFDTTHETLKAERFFRQKKIPFKPIVKPRGIESQCGMAERIERPDADRVISLSRENNLSLLGIYAVGSEGDWTLLKSP